MSRPITQPVNQVRLTNVAVVRMNRCGRRFEVACYRNKIVNYRQGIETDLSEVLQTDRVFSNVSKGRFASASDLRDAFGTSDEEEACRIILERGQVQVSDRERSARLESTLREVAATVSAKCVDPNSNRPYTPSQIRDAMREVGFMVHPTRSVKQQFLDCVRLLREKGALDIERAKMELRVVVPAERGEEAARRLREVGATDLVIASEDGGGEGGGGGPSSSHRRIVFLVDPSLYRAVDAVASKECGGRLEILRQCVAEEGDAELESEVQRKSQRRRGDRRDREAAPAAAEAEAAATAAASDDEDEDADAAKMARRMERAALVADGNGDGDGDGDANRDLDEEGEADGGRRAAAPARGAAAAATDDRDGGDVGVAVPASGTQKKRARKKKSKKAKRREREEAAERAARIEAERARRRERAEQLGLEEEEDDDDEEDGGRGKGGGGDDEGDGDGAAASERGRDADADADSVARADGGGGAAPSSPSSVAAGDVKSCNTCGGAFPAGQRYRAHFRSDWHRYNVKLKMRGASPVSEREFELCDSDAFFEDKL